MSFIGLGLVGAVLGPTLPYLAELTRTNFSQISILFVARSLGYLGGSAFSGYLYDRLPGHPLMAVSLVGLGIMLILTPQNALLWVLITILFLTGASQGSVDVGGNTLIVWQYGNNVGPYMNALHMFYGVGTFLAPVIIAQALLSSSSITWGYWIIAAFVFIPAIQLIFLPSQQIPPKDSEDIAAASKRSLVFLAALFLFCYSGFANIFGGWIFSYVIRLDLTSEANAAYITSMFWGAFMVGRLISIPVAARFRPSSILLGDLVGCLLSISVILIWPTSLTSIWVGAAGLGLFCRILVSNHGITCGTQDADQRKNHQSFHNWRRARRHASPLACRPILRDFRPSDCDFQRVCYDSRGVGGLHLFDAGDQNIINLDIYHAYSRTAWPGCRVFLLRKVKHPSRRPHLLLQLLQHR